MADPKTFAINLEKLAQKIQKNANVLKQTVAGKIGETLVRSTPVGNPSAWKSPPPKDYHPGNARANWRAGAGAPTHQYTEAVDPDGTATVAQMKANLAQAQPGDPVWITNDAPHISALNNGWSSQAPIGFIEASIQEGLREAIDTVKLTED